MMTMQQQAQMRQSMHTVNIADIKMFVKLTENSILDVKKNEKGGELYTTFVGDKDAGSVELGN